MAESDCTNGVLWGSFGTRGRIAGVLCVTVGDRSEGAGAVPAARPAGGDTVRTSLSEGKVGEDGSLDILKTELRSSLCEGHDQPRKFSNRTQPQIELIWARKPLNANFKRIEPGFAR